MIIVHLVPEYNPNFKYQEYYLAKEHGKAGNTVYIITGIHSVKQKKVESEYFEIIYLPILFRWSNRIFLSSLYPTLKKISPDILVVHTIFNFFTFQLLFRKKIAKKYIFDDHMTFDQI